MYTTDGFVLRSKPFGENDRLITLLTPKEGRITAVAKGGRSLKSGSLPATQLFSYGNYEINHRGDYKWIRGASVLRQFPNLTSDIAKVALASYLASVADELSGENEEGEEILRLMLNSCYALDTGMRPDAQIKASFELRAAAMSGFMPDLSACRGCHRESADVMYLDVMNGRILCDDCMRRAALLSAREKAVSEDIREAEIFLPLSPSVTAAIRFVLNAGESRFLAFSLDAEELEGFCRAAETYLLSHLGHGFDTLEFYRSVKD